MKKYIILLFLFFIFFITHAEEVSFYELSNNSNCLMCEKEIASKIPIDEIAVVNKGKSVLCGIITEENFSDNERANIEKIIRSHFSKIKKIRIEADNKKARDIIELSYYSSGKLGNRVLLSRFNFLISKD